MIKDIEVTPLDIQQHQFSVRFRGFDIQEVDEFLEQIAHTLEALYDENERLIEENQTLRQDRNGIAAREGTLKQTIADSEMRIEQMNEAARKSAEMIIADAEVQAEKVMDKSSSRLAQIHEDIIQLKSQRIQLEAQLRSVIEAHYKLFEMGKAQMKMQDEEYDKARMAKHTEASSQ
ncbi:MAG: DivIVA domain-containing protein [Desulfatirhabdiaceae bacterium]|nr:DivIVA domain-containing protein [Desulfatirhabdiaceae bacterium]